VAQAATQHRGRQAGDRFPSLSKGRRGMSGVFVTGTDTGIGKTVACTALLGAMRAAGVRCVPMKPVAAGAELRDGLWVNEDVEALVAAADRPELERHLVCPNLFIEAIAPHIAASRETRSVDLDAVVRAFAALERVAEFVVVEGVGGFKVPLGPQIDSVDLAKELGLPVVLVVGMKLGCLNHALLTREAIARAGLKLAGWIANEIDPEMRAIEENVDALSARMAAPLIARFPHVGKESLPHLADLVRVDPLLATLERRA
jgi:dethiobiotin synthetase